MHRKVYPVYNLMGNINFNRTDNNYSANCSHSHEFVYRIHAGEISILT